MLKRCEYCDCYFEDYEEKCDNCGGVNSSIRRTADKVPETIDELNDYCNKNKIPATKLHFYIGVNCIEPKIFGIYKDDVTGDFIVYKNKDTGERAIRYQGTDEKYAVNEIYQKLKEILIIARKQTLYKKEFESKYIRTSSRNSSYSYGNYSDGIPFLIITFIMLFFPLFLVFTLGSSVDISKTGKYTVDNNIYYYENGYWFDYNDDGSWTYNPDFYMDFSTDTYTYESSNLEISPYLSEELGEGNYDYEEAYSSSSFWSDYDWDDSDWDSNWDSDWSDSSYDYDYSYDWSSDW